MCVCGGALSQPAAPQLTLSGNPKGKHLALGEFTALLLWQCVVCLFCFFETGSPQSGF